MTTILTTSSLSAREASAQLAAKIAYDLAMTEYADCDDCVDCAEYAAAWAYDKALAVKPIDLKDLLKGA